MLINVPEKKSFSSYNFYVKSFEEEKNLDKKQNRELFLENLVKYKFLAAISNFKISGEQPAGTSHSNVDQHAWTLHKSVQ
mgnify:CR=1 FL=1